MTKTYFAIIFTLLIGVSASVSTPAQFGLNIPKITIQDVSKGGSKNKDGGTKNVNAPGSKLVYEPQKPNATPVLLKNTIYIQAKAHDEYWKMPGQVYSSWVPIIRFYSFYNNEKDLNYKVEYFDPDGSPWYSEKLEQGRLGADRTVKFESPSPYNGTWDKSTIGTGVYSFKIIDADKQQVIYQGKFKVGKFGKTSNPRERNKVDFFVDHDWLLPVGIVGFHHTIDGVGGTPVLVSVWLKGPVEAGELEGRVFYKGQQIVSTKDIESGAADYDERMSDFAPPFAPQNRWKRWEFQWSKLLLDNNGTFNHEDHIGAHYIDKNPGDYLVKIYRNGEQIRELTFTVGSDGRLAVPGYMSEMFLPYYRIVVPAKVLGTAEKWDMTLARTEAFYANPLMGSAAQ